VSEETATPKPKRKGRPKGSRNRKSEGWAPTIHVTVTAHGKRASFSAFSYSRSGDVFTFVCQSAGMGYVKHHHVGIGAGVSVEIDEPYQAPASQQQPIQQPRYATGGTISYPVYGTPRGEAAPQGAPRFETPLAPVNAEGQLMTQEELIRRASQRGGVSVGFMDDEGGN
jgi:hypothetical protein